MRQVGFEIIGIARAEQADLVTHGQLDFALDNDAALLAFVPAGRRLVFLEGGYDLGALSRSTTACLGAMADVDLRPEPATSGGPGATVVRAVAERRAIDHEIEVLTSYGPFRRGDVPEQD